MPGSTDWFIGDKEDIETFTEPKYPSDRLRGMKTNKVYLFMDTKCHYWDQQKEYNAMGITIVKRNPYLIDFRNTDSSYFNAIFEVSSVVSQDFLGVYKNGATTEEEMSVMLKKLEDMWITKTEHVWHDLLYDFEDVCEKLKKDDSNYHGVINTKENKNNVELKMESKCHLF